MMFWADIHNSVGSAAIHSDGTFEIIRNLELPVMQEIAGSTSLLPGTTSYYWESTNEVVPGLYYGRFVTLGDDAYTELTFALTYTTTGHFIYIHNTGKYESYYVNVP